jgi:hydroxymethylpyrimidine pyrophosphatase-like HAD family hydrolase
VSLAAALASVAAARRAPEDAMIFAALATDYDGTLATDGRVDAPTIEALRRLRSCGVRLVMVTGRQLVDLERVFDALELFDAAVVENGAVVFFPRTARTLLIGEPPPQALVQALQLRGVEPLAIGQGLLATSEPHQAAVLEAIREAGLEWQVIFNKGAVMVLPPGVNKATGLGAALAELELSPFEVVGVGDAENDHAFLSVCGFAVAVANALPALKATADLVTQAGYGAGVTELINGWLDDPARIFGKLTWRSGPLGESAGR